MKMLSLVILFLTVMLAIASVVFAQVPLSLADHVIHAPSYTGPVTTHRRIMTHVKSEVIPVLQINPAYTSAYSPTGYDSSSQASLMAEIQQLKLLVQSMALRQQAQLAQPPVVVVPAPVPGPLLTPRDPAAILLQQQELAAQLLLKQQQAAATTQSVPLPPAPPPPVLSGASLGLFAVQTHCAVCHTSGKLAPGVPYALLDDKGKLVALSDTQKKMVLKRTYKKTMPPPVNTFGMTAVSDLEYAGLVETLD